jgi:hypothetical protein
MNMSANETTRPLGHASRRLRIRLGLGITFTGLVVFLLGVAPQLFRMDRSQPTGFLQIAVFVIGLALICLGGYICLNTLWNGTEKTIIADVGLRVVSTGFVIAVTSGMADVFGFGNHSWPRIPYFGPTQAVGVLLGEFIIAAGFLLLIPYPTRKRSSKRGR